MISHNRYKAFWHTLRSSDNFLLTTHVNPDGDGLCSMLILAMVLKSMGKNYYIIMEDLFPQKYRFLLSRHMRFVVPEYIHVPRDYSLDTLLPERFRPESLIIIDTHSLFRLGGFARDIHSLKLKHVFVLDHHCGKSRLPHTHYLVEPGASSTSEIVYELLKANHFRVTRPVAELLYLAIATDTKNFSQSNTTSRTHVIIGDLLKTGLKPEEMSYYSQELPASTLKVFARVIARLRTAFQDQVVWSYITRGELKRCINADVDGLIEMLRNVKGTRMAILFKEVGEKEIKVCLRGKRNFNVFRIAREWGGGGHLQAAGFPVKKDLKQGIELVLKKIKTYL